jgi:hypothetical protein
MICEKNTLYLIIVDVICENNQVSLLIVDSIWCYGIHCKNKGQEVGMNDSMWGPKRGRRVKYRKEVTKWDMGSKEKPPKVKMLH